MKKSKAEKVIMDNSVEKIIVRWDTERFALIKQRKSNDLGQTTQVILLNPIEGMILLKFLGSCGMEE